MNDDELADLRKRFSVAMRPLPAMSLSKKAADEVISLWDAVAVDTGARALPRIWDKIVAAHGDLNLRASEWLYVPNLLFADCDDRRRKLCVFPEIYLALLRSALKSKKDDRFLKGLLFDFFFEYPPEALESSRLKAFQAIFEQAADRKYSTLFSSHYLAENAVTRTAERIPPTEAVAQFLELRPEISPDGEFARRVWLQATSRYKRLLEDRRPGQPLEEALNFMRSDFDAILRNKSSIVARVRLARVVLEWFFDHRSVIPSAGEQEALFRFFSYVLGDRNDARYAERWERIPEHLLALFDFWALGRRLNGAFDAVEKGLGRDWDAKAAWRQRKFFWLRYWRSGRIKQVSLFASRKQIFELQKTLRDGSLSIPVGLLRNRSGQSIMLLIALEDGLTAFEFSHNGALRFMKNLSQNLWSARDLDFNAIQIGSITSISHTSYWVARADDAIERLTGRKRPPQN